MTFHKLLSLESEEHLHVGEGYWEELEGLPTWKRGWADNFLFRK